MFRGFSPHTIRRYKNCLDLFQRETGVIEVGGGPGDHGRAADPPAPHTQARSVFAASPAMLNPRRVLVTGYADAKVEGAKFAKCSAVFRHILLGDTRIASISFSARLA